MSIWNQLKLVQLASHASCGKGITYWQSKSVLSGEEFELGINKGYVSLQTYWLVPRARPYQDREWWRNYRSLTRKNRGRFIK